MIKLSPIQRRVLAEITLDCRAPVSIVAKKLKLREHVVRNAITFLRDNLQLRPFVFSDPFRQGLTAYRVYLSIRSGDSDRLKEMLTHLSELSATTWLSSVYGSYHYAMAFRTSSLAGLRSVFMELDRRFGDLIHRRTVCVLARSVQFVPWLAHDGKGPRKSFEYTIGDFPEILDDTDRKILDIVRHAPLAPVTELSRRAGLPSSTVAYRLEKLVSNKIIVGFSFSNSHHVSGTESFLILIALQGFGGDTQTRLIEFARSHKAAVWASETIGEWNVELEVAVDNPLELQEIVQQIYQVGRGFVREVVTLSWGQELKV